MSEAENPRNMQENSAQNTTTAAVPMEPTGQSDIHNKQIWKIYNKRPKSENEQKP